MAAYAVNSVKLSFIRSKRGTRPDFGFLSSPRLADPENTLSARSTSISRHAAGNHTLKHGPSLRFYCSCAGSCWQFEEFVAISGSNILLISSVAWRGKISPGRLPF